MSERGQFTDLDDQLQRVIVEILNNENICKLLYYNTPDALSQPPVEDTYSLLRTRIYTQTFKPPTDSQSTYITVFFNDFDALPNNPYLKHGRLFINIMTHRDLWDINGGLRVVKIMGELDLLLNRNRVTNSITKDFFKNAKYTPVSDLYNSYSMTYSNIDV
jgi:hypothetical protein